MRILIADDEHLVREYLIEVCAKHLGHEVEAVSSGKKALDAIIHTSFDVAILDIRMPDLDGFGVIRGMRIAGSRTKVLVISGYCDDYITYRVEQIGVDGFLDKLNTGIAHIIQAMNTIAGGGQYYSDAFKLRLSARRKNPASFDKLLTNAERAILEAIAGLMGNHQIAQEFGITEQTLNRHMYNIRQKLGLNSRNDMIRYALNHGVIKYSDSSPSGDLMALVKLKYS